jgi:hypothetical protein
VVAANELDVVALQSADTALGAHETNRHAPTP